MIRTEEIGTEPCRVLVCTIDRPERRNALDSEHLDGLLAVFDRVRSEGFRSVVLTGAGSAFCAGADLSHVEDADAAAQVGVTIRALADLPVCSVAWVGGPALGAGCQLAIACDLRMVGEGARFGIPSSKLGVMVDHWTIDRLAQLAGQSHARAMLLAADTIDADTALNTGFVQRSGGLDEAIGWAEQAARLAPLSVAGQKLALNRLADRDAAVPPSGDADVKAAFDRVWTSKDRLEGIAAFQQKRAPEFRGE